MTDDVRIAAPEARDGSVVRVVSLLTCLAQEPETGLSIRQAAQRSGISRSAVQRTFAKLAAMGVAKATPDGSYAAGPVLYELATQLISGSTMLEFADRIMRDLVARVEETVCLTHLVPTEERLIFLHAVQCRKPVQYVVPVGSTAHLYAGAAGKAVLAWLPRTTLERLEMSAITPSTPTDREALAAELDAIRERGYAISMGERFPEAVGIASPVFSDVGIVGSMSITVPRSRFDQDQLPHLSEQIRSASGELSALLRGQRLSAVGEGRDETA